MIVNTKKKLVSYHTYRWKNLTEQSSRLTGFFSPYRLFQAQAGYHNIYLGQGGSSLNNFWDVNYKAMNEFKLIW